MVGLPASLRVRSLLLTVPLPRSPDVSGVSVAVRQPPPHSKLSEVLTLLMIAFSLRPRLCGHRAGNKPVWGENEKPCDNGLKCTANRQRYHLDGGSFDSNILTIWNTRVASVPIPHPTPPPVSKCSKKHQVLSVPVPSIVSERWKRQELSQFSFFPSSVNVGKDRSRLSSRSFHRQ